MAWSASALSLGSPRGNVVLGSPFDVVVSVQPDSGSELGASCVSAQLHAGDRPIEASRVRVTTLASGQAVRVQASYTVDEPVLTLKLLAGCQGAVSRTYTLLSQLPEAVQAAGAGGGSNQPINVAQLASAGVAMPSGAQAPVPAAAPAPTPAVARARASTQAPAAPAPRKAPAKAVPNKARDAAAAAAALSAVQPPLRIEPRLRMEPLGDWLGADPKAPAADAAASAPDTLPDASAEQLAQAGQRVLALETEVSALKKRSGTDSTQIAQLRAEIEALRQESGSSSWLFNALLLALAAAVAAIGWLAWRLRSASAALRSDDQRAWRESVERSAGADEPALDTQRDELDTVITHPTTRSADLEPATRPHDRHGPDTMASPYLQRSIHMQPGVSYELKEDLDPHLLSPLSMAAPLPAAAAMVPPAGSKAAAAPADEQPAGAAIPAVLLAADAMYRAESDKARRMVQPEQMFDVQQQAEFFISVGEHQQAIALLRAHIDAHEDSSPLAYLELLHLYYTLSRREDYDQLRQRFSQHFNAQVPGMAGFTDKGSGLLQGYPEQLAQIEALWPSDEVQDCLAQFLFREDGAAAQDAPPAFDLAAFDELLLLLSIVDGTSADARGVMQDRVRTTPRHVPGSTALPVPPPAASGLPAAFLAPHGSSDEDPGLEFTLPESLQMEPPGKSTPAAPAPAPEPEVVDSRSAPLHFDLTQLDFDISKAELPEPGRIRSVPLQPSVAYRGDGTQAMLDIDLTELAPEDALQAELPSRFKTTLPAPAGASAPGELELALELENWQLEPPDSQPASAAAAPPDHGLDDILGRSVDMLLSRETDPVFRGGKTMPQPEDELSLEPPKTVR